MNKKNILLLSSILLITFSFTACGNNTSTQQNNKPTTSITEAKKTHINGEIISFENTNITAESVSKYNGGIEEAFKDADTQEKVFKNLDNLIYENKISGYEWDYTELTISYPDGRKESVLYNSSQEE